MTAARVSRPSRLLRTEEEIFAAGREVGKTLPPLTESQVNACAAIFAPVLNESVNEEEGVAAA